MKRYIPSRKIAVVGANATGRRLAAYLRKHRYFSFQGFLCPDFEMYLHVNGDVSELLINELQVAHASGVYLVYIAVPVDQLSKVPLLLEAAERIGIRIKFVPDIRGSLANPFHITYFGDEFPVISLREEPLEEIGARFKKRMFDLIFSSLVLVFILSWLIPLIAVCIKLTSKGPVFYSQNRAGRDNKYFRVLKFRTMSVTESDGEYRQATRKDPRITSIGAFLRRTSLDELPQFFNVLIGQMSVVGPRPHPFLLNQQYQQIVDKYMVRHFVKPGITGWAQVNGYRGETNDASAMEGRVECDIWYLENWTLMLDVRIIFMTVINILRGEKNAY